MKRFVVAFLLALFRAETALAAFAIFMVAASGGGGGGFTPAWLDENIGAGGYVTDIQIYPDGTKVVRTDTNEYFLWNGSIWSQLFTAASVPAGTLSSVISNGPGSVPIGGTEIGLCAYTTSSATTLVGSTSIMYAVYQTEIYKSTNQGVTWTDAGQSITMAAGGGNDGTVKAQSPYVWCDPASSGQVAYVSQSTGSVYETTDGGSTWATVSGPAAATSSRGSMIVGDPNSTVTAGVTQTVYIFVPGSGVYVSTNGGGSWSLTTSGPSVAGRLYIDKFSQLWVSTNGANTTLYKYASGTWSTVTISVGSGSSNALAIDPTSASTGAEHLVTVLPAGPVTISNNGGSTWSGASYTHSIYSPADIPWIGTTPQGAGSSLYIDASAAAFDESGNLFIAAGYAVYEVLAPVPATGVSFHDQSQGIEQLVGNDIISPSGLSPAVGNWDRAVFGNNIPGQYAVNQFSGVGTDGALRSSWSVAAAPGTYTLAAIVNAEGNGSSDISAVSTDGGTTWTPWAAKPTSQGAGGGMVAMSTDSVWVAVDGGGNVPYCTTNGGASWTIISFPGSPGNNWLSSYYLNRQVLASDSSGNLYAYDTSSGLYEASSGQCASWSHQYSSSIDAGHDSFNATLLAVPGQAGHLFFTSGQNTCGASPPQPCPQSWFRSTNSGTSWSAVTGFKEVLAFAFGAPKPGGSGYPAIYALGWYNVAGTYTYGMWQSDDNASTWTELNNGWGPTSLNRVPKIAADPDVYGRVYETIGGGAGAVFYDTSDACPWVGWVSSVIKPGQSITRPATLTAQGSGLVPVTSVAFVVDGTTINTFAGGATGASYSYSWPTGGGFSSGAHTLSVVVSGNGCTGVTKSIPITTTN